MSETEKKRNIRESELERDAKSQLLDFRSAIESYEDIEDLLLRAYELGKKDGKELGGMDK